MTYGDTFDFTDNVAPTSTATITPDGALIQVALAGADDIGLSGIEYRIGGGRWTRYDGPFSVDPALPVVYRAVDVNGNIEGSHLLDAPTPEPETVIYLPLVVICICGRALIPDLQPGQTDEIVPRMAMKMTADLPFGSFWGGLILAAPFGAVMATVSSYLVVIASGLVRDVYQRFINPRASTRTLRLLSSAAMVIVGGIAVVANIRPVAYLQAIVVFSGTGAAATFCMPGLLLAYWRRATVPGIVASMLAGAGSVLGLYVCGFMGVGGDPLIGPVTSFRPYYLLGLDPILWGLASSLVVGVVVSLLTPRVDPGIVSAMFDACPDPARLADLRADSIDSHLTTDG